ncbi:MAG: aspartate ammonia-lyase, partial [Candidatus ainarchaeum sp.]|nr:aspartate ammonia-lyase [Candidatus ainarchaeum sp.]
MKTRKESDFLGSVEVPAEAYYGVFTVRALRNFSISGIKAPEKFIRSLALVKKACALANMELGLLDKRSGNAIVQAADEVIKGKHTEQFPLDVYQAGAGTPYNMNMNEVLSNRALEILGQERGKYEIVNPNNHANMSQSSNDVIPTATRISVLYAIAELLPSLEKLEKALERKGDEFSKIVKTGRTHYQDAVPITLGQEFHAYANRIREAEKRIKNASEELKNLGIGGTAIGTGINTHPKFSGLVVERLNAESGFGLKVADDKIDKTQNFDDFVSVSNSLRMLCVDLLKISNDLKLLNSGPNAGIAEIMLPEVEPGSSIMPGKVNPSIPECLDMVCFEVMGRDQAVMLGAANGVLELNVYTPLIMHDLLDSLSILKNAIGMFSDLCIEG